MVDPRKASEETNDAEETPIAQSKSVVVAKPNNTLALAGLGLGVLGTALGATGLFFGLKANKKVDVLFEGLVNLFKENLPLQDAKGYALVEKFGVFLKKADFSDDAIKEFETTHLSEGIDKDVKKGCLDLINKLKHQEFKPPSSNDGIESTSSHFRRDFRD
jgi:hypothetical protein